MSALIRVGIFRALIISFGLLLGAVPAVAQSAGFKQALAEAVVRDKTLAAFYQARAFKPVWTSSRDSKRRRALVQAFKQAPAHGLPAAKFDPNLVNQWINSAKDPISKAKAEAALSRMFLDYARAVQTGLLTPSRVDSEIVRMVPYRDQQKTLEAFYKSSPSGFLNALPPQSPEYTRLMAQKVELERLIGRGGWGAKVPNTKLSPGASGNAVVALRNRLAAMGFARRSTSATYDESLVGAVQQFQLAHGLSADGVVGPGTLKELNKGAEERLVAVIVAMERERWINRPLGRRHIWVNIADFHANVVDNGRVTFRTRAVVGKAQRDRRSPEFSDVMEFMIINPSWYVPRSITVKEYLPLLQRNSNAVSHLELRDHKGRSVSRSNVNFANFNESTFPYSMRQPPSRGNALGMVKFMFPNRYNIYLHDTPAKSLFGKESRAYSHGCIRLHQPFEFAYTLLKPQTGDPVGFFKSKLATGSEQRVNLKQPVPVHIVYRTAYTDAKGGHMQYRRDVYGRDAKIWRALQSEGVALRAVRG